MFSDWGSRPSEPKANESPKMLKHRAGFGRGEPIIETFDAIPHEEAERHMDALKKQQERKEKK